MVTVGRIVRPHGNRGHVVVESETDFASERFAPGAVLFVNREGIVSTLTVSASRPYDGRWVVGFDGQASIDAAEACRGLELRIPEADLRELGPGQYYVHDLRGCRVLTGGGVLVGTVERVDAGTGVALLVVVDGADEVLVPMTDAICRQVNLAAREIVIDPPEGLIELNRRGR